MSDLSAQRGTSRRRLLTWPLSLDPRAAAADHWIRIHRRAMACRFEITLSGEDAADVPAARAALDEADRLEEALSVFRDTSHLTAINRTAADAPVAIDAELFALLDTCRRLHDDTGGAFDITSTPLSRCWGFLHREGRLPPLDAIDSARALVGMTHVALDAGAQAVRFAKPGVELNMGSIGKGYAVQRMCDLLARRGAPHALVSAAGSSIAALGGRGRGWEIDLHSRQRAGTPLARVFLRNGALATSGAGEQFIEVDGRRYGHVLDPRTGWPASGVLSATAIAGDAATADALATAFLVGGVDLARAYCASHPETLAVVFPDDGSPRARIFGSFRDAIVEDA